MRVSLPSSAVAWFTLVSVAGCYESATPSETVDGGGVSVTVLANTYTQVGYRTKRVPVSGAFVVARRCDSTEQHEARTNASGVALLAFDALDCWTVTAVHPAQPYAVSRVEVNPATDGPLVLLGDGTNPPGANLFSSVELAIEGRATAGSDVNLLGDGVALGQERRIASNAGWHTTTSAADVFDLPGIPPPFRIFAVELDGTKMPIGFGRITFDSTSDPLTIDVGMLHGPVVSRTHTITLTSGGPLALGDLAPNSARCSRKLADDWWSLPVGLGAFGSVEHTASATTHHVQMRELDVTTVSEGLLAPSDSLTLGPPTGPFLSITLDAGVDAIVIPPLAYAHAEISSASAFEIAIGGPGYVGSVAITHDNTGRERGSFWFLSGPADIALRLTELPPLPSGRGLSALRLSGLRGATIHVRAGGNIDAGDGGMTIDASWSVSLERITIAP